MTRQESIIWAAGFLEGEGFFTVKRSKQQLKRGDLVAVYTSYVIGASQVNTEPLLRLQEIFGGRIHPRTKVNTDGVPHRPWSSWELSNRESVLETTRLIAKYLSDDRRQRIPWLAEALHNAPAPAVSASTESTPLPDETEGPFRLYRLCLCDDCGGSGKQRNWADHSEKRRCPGCRGEGRSLELVATATDPESVGVALVTLAREGEWEECPIGLLYRPEGKTGTWLVRPWLPSARNLSDAGRTLASARHRDIISRSDPKHPDWHSVHADLYDSREGK